MEGHRPTEAELTGFNIEYKKTDNGATHKSKIEVSYHIHHIFFHLLNLVSQALGNTALGAQFSFEINVSLENYDESEQPFVECAIEEIQWYVRKLFIESELIKNRKKKIAEKKQEREIEKKNDDIIMGFPVSQEEEKYVRPLKKLRKNN